MLDTGVQRLPSFTDLNLNMLAWGVNTGDKKASTEWTSGKGSPWQWLLDKDRTNAKMQGHGTCVAGVIMAGINNDQTPGGRSFADFCGISPQNKILPIAMKNIAGYISDSAYFNSLTMVGCIKRVYDPKKEFGQIGMTIPFANIEVANCSFGSYRSSANKLETRHLNSLTQYIVFVAAAGNDGLPKSAYPAAHPATIAVAGHDQLGKRAMWTDNFVAMSSNHTAIDISAPGFAILTTDMSGYNSFNQPLGFFPDERANVDGTSGSAAHVSAVAAMLCNRYPSLSPAQIKQRLIEKARLMPQFSPGTAKALDAFEALR